MKDPRVEYRKSGQNAREIKLLLEDVWLRGAVCHIDMYITSMDVDSRGDLCCGVLSRTGRKSGRPTGGKMLH